MVEDLSAAGVEAYVVACPAGAELLAAGGELTDDIREALVVRCATCFGAEDLHRDVRDGVPVVVERARPWVEEAVAREVRRVACVVHVCLQSAGRSVAGDDVESAVGHDGGGAC